MLRFSIYMDNVKMVEKQNKLYYEGKSNLFLGVNKWSDLSDEEFREHLA